MTLTIHTEEDKERQLAVTIEVEEKRVDKAMRKTARKLAGRINIPGFRRGKAPYSVLVRQFGQESIRADTIDEIIQPIFEEALTEIEEVPFAQATFDDMEMEPLVLKFTIPLAPQITLGDYRELRKEIEPVVVSDEALADALERVQSSHQVLEVVERGVELGDMVTLSGVGELVAEEVEEDAEETVRPLEGTGAVSEPSDSPESEETEETTSLEEDANHIIEEAMERIIFNEEHTDLVMDSEKLFPNTPFVENVVGMVAGDEREFRFTFSDEHEDEELAGKEVEFKIEVLEVQSRDLPELDDELAKQEGEYETVDELRDGLKKQLQTQAETEANNQMVEDMIDDLLKDAELVYPPAAIKSELDGMVENFKSQATRSGWEWDDFLMMQGQNEDDLREEFKEAAVKRLERQLVLRQLILEEKLTVEANDVDELLDERVAAFGDNEELQESMRNYYQSGYGFDMISSEILMNKAHKRIEAILTGTAPDLAELEAAEAAASAESEEE